MYSNRNNKRHAQSEQAHAFFLAMVVPHSNNRKVEGDN
jgi:hypothetical protein